MAKCVGCKFYDRNENHADDGKGIRWGKCRRAGPMMHPVSVKSYLVEGIWPHVRDDDWCGEWIASERGPSTATEGVGSLMQVSRMPIRMPASATAPGPATAMAPPALHLNSD